MATQSDTSSWPDVKLVKASQRGETQAFEELVDVAAQSRVVHNDDTHMPVVELMTKI